MAFTRSWAIAAALLAATSAPSFAQSLGNLTNPGPTDGTIYGFLMTDNLENRILHHGGVLTQDGKAGHLDNVPRDNRGALLALDVKSCAVVLKEKRVPLLFRDHAAHFHPAAIVTL